MFQSLIFLLAGGVLGVLLSPSEDTFKNLVAGTRGELTGKWRQTCAVSYHKPYARVDAVRVTQRADGKVSGTVRRVEPGSERGRKWRLSGLVSGDELVLIFQPCGRNYDGSSYGAIVLHRSAHGAGNAWCGSYVRPGTDVDRPPGVSNWERVDLTWSRGVVK